MTEKPVAVVRIGKSVCSRDVVLSPALSPSAGVSRLQADHGRWPNGHGLAAFAMPPPITTPMNASPSVAGTVEVARRASFATVAHELGPDLA